MSKYIVVFDDESLNDEEMVFDTEEEAEEHGLYMVGCCRQGAEILHMSNPGDYEYDPDTWVDPEFEVEEIDE